MTNPTNYLGELFDIIRNTQITDGEGKALKFDEGIGLILSKFVEHVANGRKVFVIGNGGSAAIAGHMALDLWRNAGIPAMAFNEGPLLTCVGNDFGYEKMFAKPLSMFAEAGDILVAISSSGASENILEGTEAAYKKGCTVITLSGFSGDNPLRKKGYINIYVPSNSYGYVEVAHQCLTHLITDLCVESKTRR